MLHAGVDRSALQDGGMWDWFAPPGRLDAGDSEITYPKRLVQQIESEEEMAHDFLDTRVKNSSRSSTVSFWISVNSPPGRLNLAAGIPDKESSHKLRTRSH